MAQFHMPLLTILVPIIQDLERDGTASFHFVQGTVSSPPPRGSEDFYGDPPHVRFLDSYFGGRPDEELFDEAFKSPDSSTPEQKYRGLLETLQPRNTGRVEAILAHLHDVMEKEGPFDGILGDSEGAIVAATFVVDHLRRCSEAKVQPQLKCAVFISGGPPYTPDGTNMFLADQCGQVIAIPTCHIIGYNDPLIDGAIALYHLCNAKVATLVDHGRGHRLPRDARLFNFMIKGIRDTIARTTK